jgi:hypothetical protein
VIEIPGPDERTWKIDGKPVNMNLEALTWEELHLLLQKLEEHLSRSIKARRLVRKEIERRGR